jgi:hypothetical protein
MHILVDSLSMAELSAPALRAAEASSWPGPAAVGKFAAGGGFVLVLGVLMLRLLRLALRWWEVRQAGLLERLRVDRAHELAMRELDCRTGLAHSRLQIAATYNRDLLTWHIGLSSRVDQSIDLDDVSRLAERTPALPLIGQLAETDGPAPSALTNEQGRSDPVENGDTAAESATLRRVQ